ncbi:MAG: alpha/beta fold hydrolase [Acidimicrobiales bacterium]
MLRTYGEGGLFGARTGRGAPWVLALHGWCRTHRDFDAVLGSPGRPAPGADAHAGPPLDAGTLLDAGTPVDAVALDLPGFGASPPPPEAWGARDYASAILPVVVDLAEQLGGPPVVLGHSFGGRVAVELAGSWPEAVSALVLTGVPLLRVGTGVRRAPLLFRMGKALNRRGMLGEPAMEGLRQRYGSTDYRRASGVMRDVLVRSVGESYEGALGALRCPVELVWGDGDAEVPLAVAERAGALLGDRARLTVCRGVGHMAPIEAPAALRAALERHRVR